MGHCSLLPSECRAAIVCVKLHLLRAGEAEQDIGLAGKQVLAEGELRDAAVLQDRPPRVAPRRLEQHRRVVAFAATTCDPTSSSMKAARQTLKARASALTQPVLEGKRRWQQARTLMRCVHML